MNTKCKLANMHKKDRKKKKSTTEIDAVTTLLFQGGERRWCVEQTIEKINYIIKQSNF